MLADYQFYTDTYKGILISSDEYSYFGERASDELALYTNRVPNTTEAQNDLGKCACSIADYLYGYFKTSKNGVAPISSESVNGYYSASYAIPQKSEIQKSINRAITKYIGKYILGASSAYII